MSKNIKYKKIVKDLLTSFPEYQPDDWIKSNLDLPYTVIPDFYNFILTKIKSGEDSDITGRFFSFINSYFDEKKPNHDVINLLEIEILKSLPQSEEVYDLAKQYLSPKAKEWLPSND